MDPILVTRDGVVATVTLNNYVCFDTQDCKEGVTAFLEKRKPGFKGR